jgi:hypothetical protein
MLVLPLSAEELATRLSRSLASRRDGLQMIVENVALGEPVAGAVPLRMRVTVTTHDHPRQQHWQVSVPLDPRDLDPGILPAQAFVVTVRANLEEWWDVRAAEPAVAAWGRQIR